jgi:hypothetical protein
MLNNMIIGKNRNFLCNFAQETFNNEYEKDSKHPIYFNYHEPVCNGTDKGYV